MWRNSSFRFSAFILAAISLICGCQATFHSQEKQISLSRLGTFDGAEGIKCIGQSVENRPIGCVVHGQGADVILIIAAIHGDEQDSGILCYKLNEYLHRNRHILQGRTIVLLPEANPDGVFRNSRFNARGIDLNRNFPADNRLNNDINGEKAVCEPESAVIYQLIEKYLPTRVISIHQPYKCIDYDGPGKKIAEHMAKYCDLPVKKLGSRPGSLGSYAGLELGIPIITVELGPDEENYGPDQVWDSYGKMLLSAVMYPEQVD